MSLSLQSEFAMSVELETRPVDPVGWWRTICEVTPRLAMSGGLSHFDDEALIQLREWEAAGITDYIAVHEECDDGDYIAENSSIRFQHLGVDDCGGRRDPRWFDSVVKMALEVLANPDRKLMVTCWMGCNRGPSATFAILLALGWKPLPALRAIRSVRPIAGTIYAADAVEWWIRRNGGDDGQVKRARRDVNQWFDRHPLDLHHVIGRIGSRTGGVSCDKRACCHVGKFELHSGLSHDDCQTPQRSRNCHLLIAEKKRLAFTEWKSTGTELNPAPTL